jgi:cytochrome c oxidase cbb3-type subunit 3
MTRRPKSSRPAFSRRPASRRGAPPANGGPRRHGKRAAVALLLVAEMAAAFSFVGCKREERIFRSPPPAVSRDAGVRISELQPGAHAPATPLKSNYDESAYAQNEGQQLYEAFNCVGCHAHGGGGMGPPLMDEKWRYGSDPDQIYLTIMQGRPNGMPSFRGKLNEHQAWEIVAYVRSLSGLTPRDAAPNREDHMKANPPGNSVDPLKPTGEEAPQPGR